MPGFGRTSTVALTRAPRSGRRGSRRTRSRSAARTPRRSAPASRRRRCRAARGPGRSCPSRATRSSRGRTACRTRAGCVPGSYSSAGQKRDESGVNASSPSTSRPAPSTPNSSFVSARMIPRSRASIGDERVQRERDALHLVEARLADEVGGGVAVDVLVVAGLRLRGRREDRLRQRCDSTRPAGRRVAADRPGREVVLPARAGEVAPHDALDRQHLETLALGRAAVVAQREQVVRHEMPRAREPVRREARQHAALVGDLGRQHDVEGRDPVAGDEQQPVVVERVELADLAAPTCVALSGMCVFLLRERVGGAGRRFGRGWRSSRRGRRRRRALRRRGSLRSRRRRGRASRSRAPRPTSASHFAARGGRRRRGRFRARRARAASGARRRGRARPTGCAPSAAGRRRDRPRST